MSILIKGMKMPKSCSECKLFDASRAIGLFPLGWCRVNGNEIFRLSEKADLCPLIPVPDHGDLIDMDAFMKKDVPINGYWDENDGRFHCYPPTYMQAVDDIRVAPTVIEAEDE